MGKYRYTLLFMNPRMVSGNKETSHAHWFLFKRRRFHRKGNLYLTTHLYSPDSRKITQVKNGSLRKMKFDCFDAVTGVERRPKRIGVSLPEMKRSSIGYVNDVKPRRTKKDFDPKTRMKKVRK